MDRRDFIKKSAVAGGVAVWAAPAVSTVLASAAGAASAPPDFGNEETSGFTMTATNAVSTANSKVTFTLSNDSFFTDSIHKLVLTLKAPFNTLVLAATPGINSPAISSNGNVITFTCTTGFTPGKSITFTAIFPGGGRAAINGPTGLLNDNATAEVRFNAGSLSETMPTASGQGVSSQTMSGVPA